MKLTKEQKEIKENAILIANFEGYRAENESFYGSIFYSDNNERTAIDTAYHNSWNWLMPVIEKIDDILHDWLIKTHEGEDTIEKWYEAYPHFHLEYKEDTVCVSTNILEVYKEVIEFIKWNNKNSK